MLHRVTNNTELKYIGIIVILTTLIQLVTTQQGWKDILFVICDRIHFCGIIYHFRTYRKI